MDLEGDSHDQFKSTISTIAEESHEELKSGQSKILPRFKLGASQI
jgi:hypothetical protein